MRKTASKLEVEISKFENLYQTNRFNPFRQKVAKGGLEEKQKYEAELRKTRSKLQDLEKKTTIK